MRRRTVLAGGVAFFACGARSGARAQGAASAPARFAETIKALEARSGGRLGVALLEVGGGLRLAHRGGERFPMCSTFKALLAAAVLARVDRGEETTDRRIEIPASAILDGSPFSSARAGADASVAELCEASMTLSDNAAANLLLPSVGGPQGLTRFLRSIDDPVTRLDRIEPALNEAAPGDPRDTTSPAAMAATLATLVFGETLTPFSRGALVRWLIDARTGGKRLRAGLPPDWTAGDKTGAGPNGTTNDVAVLWPPAGQPLVLACYLTGSALDAAGRDAIHADVARAAVAELSPRPE
ncbi:MAG: class A beta-lactamase [Ancylobacter novellus]|uniref:Beta-lactamase n=1 Tax=Ancylobacter novellus TaxID=921 RepID=A0A2W5M8N1_ANCNO|nr:MAG: class A beta-lactamase [Ancylobacter novellus]